MSATKKIVLCLSFIAWANLAFAQDSPKQAYLNFRKAVKVAQVINSLKDYLSREYYDDCQKNITEAKRKGIDWFREFKKGFFIETLYVSISEEIKEELKDGQATVTHQITKRDTSSESQMKGGTEVTYVITIYMVKEDGKWKIDTFNNRVESDVKDTRWKKISGEKPIKLNNP
jgi:dGTP triphosphohydrolase